MGQDFFIFDKRRLEFKFNNMLREKLGSLICCTIRLILFNFFGENFVFFLEYYLQKRSY